MNTKVILTCAVTGGSDIKDKHPGIPVTPEQIAAAAIQAAQAGAAIAHIHVRDPKTGLPDRDLELYKETAKLIRASDTDVILNITTGMGGDLYLGPDSNPLALTDETDVVGQLERMIHVEELLPEICTIDCGSMNFGHGDYVMTNTTSVLQEMTKQVQTLGVKPEIEAFDTGHLQFAIWLKEQGLIDDPVMIQLCMGIPWGAPDDLHTFLAMTSNIPKDWTFSAFSIGRNQLPYVALAILAGGNIRVGLEDNIYLKRGVLATNTDLVKKAVQTAEGMGCAILGPDQVRSNMKLVKRWG